MKKLRVSSTSRPSPLLAQHLDCILTASCRNHYGRLQKGYASRRPQYALLLSTRIGHVHLHYLVVPYAEPTKKGDETDMSSTNSSNGYITLL